MKHIKIKDLERLNRPRDLLMFGVVLYAAGFVFSAMDKFETGYIRDDTLWLGSIALFTAATLWISVKAGHPHFGKIIIRGFFAMIVVAWIYTCFQLATSDLPVIASLFLSLVLGILLCPLWLLTWWPTRVTDESEPNDLQIRVREGPK